MTNDELLEAARRVAEFPFQANSPDGRLALSRLREAVLTYRPVDDLSLLYVDPINDYQRGYNAGVHAVLMGHAPVRDDSTYVDDKGHQADRP